MMNTSQNKRLLPYLALTTGVGCSIAQTEAATVTFYGPGAQSPSTTPATPAGFEVYFNVGAGGGFIDSYLTSATYFASDVSNYFTQGDDLGTILNVAYNGGKYHNGSVFTYGSQAGSTNYANISLTGETSGIVYEAVAQFSFDGAGNGYLIAIAANETNVSMTISEGKALIDAVPEPSSLALLAMGAGGLAARRKRRKENAA